MNAQNQIKTLQQELTSLLSLNKSVIVNLKRESSRVFPLVSQYKTQKQQNGLLSDPSLKDLEFKDLEQYSSLLSKQCHSHFEELYNQHIKHKLQMERLVNDFKLKPKDDFSDRIASFKKILKEFEDSFMTIWSEEHFLALNYRLDVSAKELERWTAIGETFKTKREDIKNTVEGLFK